MSENYWIRTYPNQFSSFDAGEDFEVSWEDFVEIFKEPTFAPSKGSECQFLPGKVKEDASQKNTASVEEVHFYCLDLDGITPSDYQRVVNLLDEEGLKGIVYSTYSHYKQLQENGNYRVRFVLPLSRPVSPEEFRLLWANCRILFFNLGDTTTGHAGKHYLAYSIPENNPEAEAASIFREFSGTALDVDSILTRYSHNDIVDTYVSIEAGSVDVPAEVLSDRLDSWTKDRKVVKSMLQALGGHSYAQPGSREKTLFEAAGILAKLFPEGKLDDICEPFKASIELEEANGGPTYSDFRDKVRRRQLDTLRRNAAREFGRDLEQAREARRRSEADVFTEDSIQSYLNDSGLNIPVRGMANRLILVHAASGKYFVFNGKGYFPCLRNTLHMTVASCLQYRAEGLLGFEMHFPSDGDKPPTPKTAEALVADHGAIILNVCYDYSGASWYDAETQTLWLSEVIPPSQRLKPEFSKEVDEYLQAMAGPDLVIKLRIWLACLVNTNLALATLVLIGSTGTGKTAFATALSKIFSNTGPGSMSNFLSSFNSEVVRNPIVFADESLPKINNRVPTDRLRSMVTTSSHEVNRKNQPMAHLRGYVRSILALQDFQKFDFGSRHSKEDLVAIAKRNLIIPVNSDCADKFDYKLMVEEGALAKHALWLAENIEREDPRFGVLTDSEVAVAIADPAAMSVVDWLINYLQAKVYSSAKVAPQMSKPAVFVNKGEIYANSTEIYQSWEEFADKGPFYRSMDRAAVHAAVRSISVDTEPERIRIPLHARYFKIRTSVVKMRGVLVGSLTAELLSLILKAPHELEFSTKKFKLTEGERKERMEALQKIREAYTEQTS